MLKRRPGAERGRTQISWLDSFHSFSFGDYFDPDQMGFRSLRVLNEDRVAPGKGFGTHSHRNMEILSIVLAGALEHKDSLGSGSVLRPGEVQVMGAGTGISHSEFNHSSTEPVHFLQIWLIPEADGLPPRYAQKIFPQEERDGRLRLVASPDGRDGSLGVRQDVALSIGTLGAGEEIVPVLEENRHAWIQVARGSVAVNGQLLQQGDGAAVSEENTLRILGRDPSSEILFFDLN